MSVATRNKNCYHSYDVKSTSIDFDRHILIDIILLEALDTTYQPWRCS